MTKIKLQLMAIAHHISDMLYELNYIKNVDPKSFEMEENTLLEIQQVLGMLDISLICTQDNAGLYDSVTLMKGKSYAGIKLKEKL